MHLNHRLSICESVLKKLTHVGSHFSNRANVPFIVPSIVQKKVNTLDNFVNENKIYFQIALV